MNLDKFMCYFQGLLARDVLKLRQCSESVVFPRRYSSEPILDEEALLEKMRYVIMNPVKARIVTDPVEYPGYCSWAQIAPPSSPVQVLESTEAPPSLTPPPMWSHLGADELKIRWLELLEPDIRAVENDLAFRAIGAKKALRIKHWEKPWRRRSRLRDAKGRIRKPRAHASSVELWQSYVRFADKVTTSYRECVASFREGDVEQFPYGTKPPGWTECECNARRLIPKRCRNICAERATVVAAA
jgi:hypothetical protein